MSLGLPNQTLQATAGKCLGWQVGCQRPAVPELIRWAEWKAFLDRMYRIDRIVRRFAAIILFILFILSKPLNAVARPAVIAIS